MCSSEDDYGFTRYCQFADNSFERGIGVVQSGAPFYIADIGQADITMPLISRIKLVADDIWRMLLIKQLPTTPGFITAYYNYICFVQVGELLLMGQYPGADLSILIALVV